MRKKKTEKDMRGVVLLSAIALLLSLVALVFSLTEFVEETEHIVKTIKLDNTWKQIYPYDTFVGKSYNAIPGSFNYSCSSGVKVTDNLDCLKKYPQGCAPNMEISGTGTCFMEYDRTYTAWRDRW